RGLAEAPVAPVSGADPARAALYPGRGADRRMRLRSPPRPGYPPARLSAGWKRSDRPSPLSLRTGTCRANPTEESRGGEATDGEGAPGDQGARPGGVLPRRPRGRRRGTAAGDPVCGTGLGRELAGRLP